MVMSRGRRPTANTSRNALIFRRKSTSSRRCLQQTSEKQHRVLEAGVSDAEVNQFSVNTILCDQPLANEIQRMSTFDMESTKDGSYTTEEQTQPQDTDTKRSPDHKQYQVDKRHSMSNMSNNNFDGFYEPVSNSVSLCEQSLCSGVDASKSQHSSNCLGGRSGVSDSLLSTTVNFKQITDTELSSGIYDSRETSV